MELTERQQKIFDFLQDFNLTVTSQKITTIEPIISRHKLNAAYGTVMNILKIYSKEENIIFWNPDFECEPKLAVLLEEEYQLYPQINRSVAVFKNCLNSPEKYPIPFKIVWPVLGYLTQASAKRSLIADYKNIEDWVFNNDVENYGTAKNSKNGRPEDDIYMSKLCFLNFITTSAKPMSKYFAKKINFLLLEHEQSLLKHEKKTIAVSIFANKLDDYQTVINEMKRFQSLKADNLHNENKNRGTLTIPFPGEDDYSQHVRLCETITELIMRDIIKPIQNALPNVQLQLLEMCTESSLD